MSDAKGTITIEGPHPMYVLRLLDQRFREVGSSGAGRMVYEVTPGLYIARCEAGGPAIEKTIRVKGGDTHHIQFSYDELPRFESAAPVSGAKNNNEAHSRFAVARMDDQPDLKWAEGGARLLLMNRSLEETDKDKGTIQKESAPVPVSLEGFSVVSANGSLVVDLKAPKKRTSAADVAANHEHGRDAFLLDLPPGGYVLCWPPKADDAGDRPGLPIWLPEGWNTFVFLAVDRKQPIPDPRMISIHLSVRTKTPSKRTFDPGDRSKSDVGSLSSTATELALASLRTGRRQLSDEMLDSLLHDKFRNPMSGILGAYMLCEREGPNWELFGEVIERLGELVPGHPDIQGLRAHSKVRGWTKGSAPQAISFPPMIELGLSAIAEFDWKAEAELVKPGSMAEIASLRWMKGRPWTQFGVPVPGAPSRPAKATASATAGLGDKVKAWLSHNLLHNESEIRDILSTGIKTAREVPQDYGLRELQRRGFSKASAERLVAKATESLDAAAAFLDQPTAQPADSARPLTKLQISNLITTIIAEKTKTAPQTISSLEGWTKRQFRTFTKEIGEAIPGLSLLPGQIEAAKSVKDVVKIVSANLE